MSGRSKLRGWRLGVAGLAALALVAAACGDSSDKSDQGTTPAPTTAAPQPPTGPPIKIFAIVPEEGPAGTANFPESTVGLKAAVQGINKRGGIKGRPLELQTCPDKQDQNVAAACARDAVAAKPIALVGTSSRFAAGYFPIIKEAGIPDIGVVVNTPAIEATDPLAYPLTMGSASGPAGAGAVLADVLGAKKIVTAYIDLASAAATVQVMDGVLALRGLTQSKVTLPSTAAADYSPHAASILNQKPDGVYIATITAEADKLTLALRQAGYTGPIVRSATITPDSSIQTLGSNADNIYVPAQFVLNSSTSNADVKRFIEETDAVDKNSPKTDAMKQPYAAVYLFAAAAEKAATIDTAGVKAVLDSGETLKVPMGPTLQFKTVSSQAPNPRLFNTSVTFGVVKSGKLITANNDEFINVFEVKKK
jgi:ABC-type branched-subunit amino acid transport system substrate-binding protein